MKRNYRREIEAALNGDAPDRVPFTIYNSGIIPPGFDLPALQARGMAVCARAGICEQHTPDVKMEFWTTPDGVEHSVMRTPVGDLTFASKAAALGTAMVEHPVKALDDYTIAEFIVRNTRYQPAYDAFLAEDAKTGGAGVTVWSGPYSPLVDIQLWWIGQEQFCYELADHEDALMSLYYAFADKQREMFPIAARSPAPYLLYCGNIVPAMIGPDRIRDYVIPLWNEFADILHEQGKKLGSHLDADNRLILDLVRDSRLDFIEAFTPPPDCSVSVAEARAAWPGKALWLNFPSSVHLRPDGEIRSAARRLLAEAGDRRGFLIGITEDVPAQDMARSLNAICDALA